MGHVDGNALAGLFAEIFPFDVTAAVGRCAHCGSTGMIGDTMVYTASPEWMMRCPHCDEVLATVIDSGSRVWLNLSGLRALEIVPR